MGELFRCASADDALIISPTTPPYDHAAEPACAASDTTSRSNHLHPDRRHTQRRCAEVQTKPSSATRRLPVFIPRVPFSSVNPRAATPVAAGVTTPPGRRRHQCLLWQGLHHSHEGQRNTMGTRKA